MNSFWVLEHLLNCRVDCRSLRFDNFELSLNPPLYDFDRVLVHELVNFLLQNVVGLLDLLYLLQRSLDLISCLLSHLKNCPCENLKLDDVSNYYESKDFELFGLIFNEPVGLESVIKVENALNSF